MLCPPGTYGEGGDEPCKPCPRNTQSLPGTASVLQCECKAAVPVVMTTEHPQYFESASPQVLGLSMVLGLCVGWLSLTALSPRSGTVVVKRNIRYIIGSSSMTLLVLSLAGIQLDILKSAAVPGVGVAVFGIALYLREHYDDTVQWSHTAARASLIVNMVMLITTAELGAAYLTMFSIWAALALLLSGTVGYVSAAAVSSLLLSAAPLLTVYMLIPAPFDVCIIVIICYCSYC